MPRPKGHRTRQLSIEDRRTIRTLYYDGGLPPNEIRSRLQNRYTNDQIRYSIRADQDAPRFSDRGRDSYLTDEQTQRLVNYVIGSKIGRRASWLELSLFSISIIGIQVGFYCIRSTLRRLGFKRYIARRKPPLNDRQRALRLAWAEAHRDWTPEQWQQILWTDETWVTGGPHRQQYVTRREGEEFHQDCIQERHQRKEGWMFWGCFSGIPGQLKGPGLFWEKEWGSISEASYREHTVPLIHEWISHCRQTVGTNLILMQDGASAHGARGTRADLHERGIVLENWPPHSPDLNPIETVWCWMKDYIEDKYGHIERPSYPRLRSFVLEAWNDVNEEDLRGLLETMPQRCQDVIDQKGGSTKW